MINKNIVIVGGGPAGLEAARTLRNAGLTPILLEGSDRLGGHLLEWDSLFPSNQKASEVLESLTADLEGIKWFTNSKVEEISRIKDIYLVRTSSGYTFQANAVLLTTGFSLFNATLKQELGYGIYDRVITNADMERYFATGEHPCIHEPKTIGFVHCVGSRDEKICNRACSKVCCATAIKQACHIKEKFPLAQVYCFYMDLRMFGRGWEDMYYNAQTKYGIRFVRGRVCEVSEGMDATLNIKAEDTLLGKPIRMKMDLLVLMSGIRPRKDTEDIASNLHIELGTDGFYSPRDPFIRTNESSNEGIFLAGTCTGPATLPETFSSARSAAARIIEYLESK
ncbi:MAG: CoB--CoM heterodisulfide reductase iron-sulfur subunit A family protein [Bacteroidales bacterium]|nr:CoB--CoM heterodisulfide reductase iron-sulfur subunit A family protein [Bacteroidales bacterium]